MENRDKNYQLCGIVEVDEAFFDGPGEGGGKRGRGTEKTEAMLGVEVPYFLILTRSPLAKSASGLHSLNPTFKSSPYISTYFSTIVRVLCPKMDFKFICAPPF